MKSNTLAARVKRLREQARMTQAELARAAGLDAEAVVAPAKNSQIIPILL